MSLLVTLSWATATGVAAKPCRDETSVNLGGAWGRARAYA
jgi:hypothetical protein